MEWKEWNGMRMEWKRNGMEGMEWNGMEMDGWSDGIEQMNGMNGKEQEGTDRPK